MRSAAGDSPDGFGGESRYCEQEHSYDENGEVEALLHRPTSGGDGAAAPLLLQIGSLGFLHEGLLRAATQRFEPGQILGDGSHVPMSLAAAAAVVFAWTILSLGIGAWRTATRDA